MAEGSRALPYGHVAAASGGKGIGAVLDGELAQRHADRAAAGAGHRRVVVVRILGGGRTG